jgi:hypothetical protein
MAKNSDPSNPPGLEYLLRIGKAWESVVTGQTAALQQAWNEVRGGTYTQEKAMKLWSGLAESQFDVITEVAKGPAYVFRPAWLYFSYKMASKLPVEGAAKIDRTESQATNLDTTDLSSMSGGGGALSGSGTNSIYLTCVPTSSRREISIKLDIGEIEKQAKAGHQYMGFILGKDRGAEPPLVIVILRVT